VQISGFTRRRDRAFIREDAKRLIDGSEVDFKVCLLRLAHPAVYEPTDELSSGDALGTRCCLERG